jgi:hypothetical protein
MAPCYTVSTNARGVFMPRWIETFLYDFAYQNREL